MSSQSCDDNNVNGELFNTYRQSIGFYSEDYEQEEEDTCYLDQKARSSRVEETLNQKYNRVTSICLNRENWPVRYAYYTEDGPYPTVEEHFNISYINSPTFGGMLDIDKRVTSEWLKLNQETQDTLYMILSSGIAIWNMVCFNFRNKEDSADDRDTGTWFRRARPCGKNDFHSELKEYGVECRQLNKSVMEILCRGRSKAEMKERVRIINERSLLSQTLEDAWERALLSGGNYGSTRQAVRILLDGIVKLLNGLSHLDDWPNPYVAVLHVTSAATHDAFSISSRSESLPSVSETRSASPSPPPRKRQRSKETAGASGGDAAKLEKKSEPKIEKFPGKNQKFVDMKVISSVEGTGVAKYLLIVEVHPKGMTRSQAQQKFIKELVHVLQLQSQVFGLFISTKDMTLYKCKRAIDSEVVVTETEYNMTERTFETCQFNVVQFQKLVMDLLACFIFGIRFIDEHDE